jgi:pantoate--beta-alanine ligase
MRIIRTTKEWKKERQNLGEVSIGLVPTMGALHAGHLSLVTKCRSENLITVVSIFVNPTQFNDKQDFSEYPHTFEEDCRLLDQEGTDILFFPDYTEMYPDDFHYHIRETELSTRLCGATRPGHFEGVLTVVMKLLMLMGPTRAYFGEKDYQQFLLIKGMVEAFFLPTQIVACPLVRDGSGLALSSRNRLLSESGRSKAPRFHQVLSSGKPLDEIRQLLASDGFMVEYVEEYDGRIFGAVFLEGVRLIDNVKR